MPFKEDLKVRPRSRGGKVAIIIPLAAALSLGAETSQAQQLVFDPSAYGKLLEEAQTGLRQLEQLKSQLAQAQQLYDSLNRSSGVSTLAPVLSSPELRQLIPGAAAYLNAASGDLSGLGQIGATARRIRADNRLFTAAAEDPRGQDLERAGDRAARDLAVAETVADAGAQRLAGLEQLEGALDTAPSARAALDLQARLAAEQAMIANDQVRLQGLAMARDAEAGLARQRERERIAAEDAARLALYRGAFQ